MDRICEDMASDLDGAFERFVAATQDRVYALSRSLTRAAADADDLAQDTYLRAYRALRAYDARRIRSLRMHPWLARIAINTWRNRLRGRRRHAADALEHDPPADPRDRVEARIERADDAALVRGMLAELPERYRLAVLVRHAYGVPYAEAAAALGIPVGTLKANVHRGTRLLRERMEGHMEDRLR